MPDVPLISVLMPVHNAARYVAGAIESILGQSLGDFEFIITDDGSTDGTAEVVAGYARRDPRIRFARQPNAGITHTLNVELAQARGSLLARMDGDDVSLPQRFEKQVRFLRDHPDHVLVGCQCELIDPDGRIICLKRDLETGHEQIDQLLLHQRWPIVHPAVMMRRGVVRQIGGYNERYHVNEDHELFLRLAEVGKLANLPEMLFQYRQHFGSAGFTKVEAQMREVLAICKTAHERRGLPIPPDLTSKDPQLLTPIAHRRNWAWWALRDGNPSTARHHAAAVLRSAPLSPDSWKLMYCAIRGR